MIKNWLVSKSLEGFLFDDETDNHEDCDSPHYNLGFSEAAEPVVLMPHFCGVKNVFTQRTRLNVQS